MSAWRNHSRISTNIYRIGTILRSWKNKNWNIHQSISGKGVRNTVEDFPRIKIGQKIHWCLAMLSNSRTTNKTLLAKKLFCLINLENEAIRKLCQEEEKTDKHVLCYCENFSRTRFLELSAEKTLLSFILLTRKKKP